MRDEENKGARKNGRAESKWNKMIEEQYGLMKGRREGVSEGNCKNQKELKKVRNKGKDERKEK